MLKDVEERWMVEARDWGEGGDWAKGVRGG